MIRIVFLAMAAGALLPCLAQADTRDDVMNAMQLCAVIRDDRVWLDCTYGAQQAMRAKLGLPPASDYQQRLVPPSPNYPQHATSPGAALASYPATPPVPPATMQRRGTVMQELGGTAPPVTASRLAGMTYDAGGAFTVTLENGQVWHQADDVIQAKAKFKPGARITILPGALWSYNLKAEGTPHIYKVSRRS